MPGSLLMTLQDHGTIERLEARDARERGIQSGLQSAAKMGGSNDSTGVAGRAEARGSVVNLFVDAPPQLVIGIGIEECPITREEIGRQPARFSSDPGRFVASA